MAKAIALSAGHAKNVQGAIGIINEVEEARRVLDRVCQLLGASGVTVYKFKDDTSRTKQENLKTIVAWHDSKKRDLDVSIHFNAGGGTGTEVLYKTQEKLAERVSNSISLAGLKNRGAKERLDLHFLNTTDEPAILIEVCFVDSQADVSIYKKNFEKICKAIADSLRSI